jgi:WD40 repeat protein
MQRPLVFCLVFFFLFLNVYSQEPRLMLPIGHTESVRICRVSKDGKKLITGSSDQTVKIWDISSGVLLANIKEHKEEITKIITNPNGKHFISIDGDSRAFLWNVDNGEPALRFDSLNKTLYTRDADFYPDGSKLLTVGLYGISIWDLQTFRKINFIPVKGTVVGAFWGPQNTILVDVTEGSGGICDVSKPGGSWYRWPGSERGNATGKMRWVADSKQVVQLWESKELKFTLPATAQTIRYSTQALGLQTRYLDSCWKAYDSKPMPSWVIPADPAPAIYRQRAGNTSLLNQISLFSPDQQHLVFATDSICYLFHLTPDAADGLIRPRFEKRIRLAEPYFVNMKFSEDGSRLLVVKDYGVFDYILDMPESSKKQLYYHTGDGVNDVAFNPDHTRLFTALDAKVIITWDTKTKKYNQVFDGKTFSTLAMDFSPDGKNMITAGEEGTARIWDFQTGKPLRLLTGHTYQINQAFFIKKGTAVVTASDDGQVIIWDAASGNITQRLTDHKSGVNNVVISPNGKKMITISEDSTAILWYADTAYGKWKLLKTLTGHNQSVEKALFSPDGNLVVTFSSAPSLLIIWRTSDGKQLRTIRYRQGQNDAPGQNIDNIFFTDNTHLFLSAYSLEGEYTAEDSVDNPKLAKYRGPQVWNPLNGQLIKTYSVAAVADEAVVYTAYSSDLKRLLCISYDNYLNAMNAVYILDAITGKKLYTLENNKWSSLRFINALISNDGQTALINLSSGYSFLVNMNTGKEKAVLQSASDDLLYARFSPDNRYLLGAAGDNTHGIWDVNTGALQYRFFSVDTLEDYLVLDQYNRYDGTQKAKAILYFTCGTEVILLEQFKSLCWEPGLVGKIMGLDKDPIKARKLSEINICNKTPLVNNIASDSIAHRFLIQPRDGGLGEVQLFVNGKMVKRYKSGELVQKGKLYELVVADSAVRRYFESGSKNALMLKATTQKGDMTSRGMEIIMDPRLSSTRPQDIYIFSIGINRYKDSTLHLNYAAGDAWAFAKTLSASASKLFNTDTTNHVFTWIYNTDSSGVSGRPSKKEITAAMDSLAKRMKPEDILVFFFAGHGVQKAEQKSFYLLTSDATRFDINGVEKEVAISTDEINEWLQRCSPHKQLLILDACNSGQAVKDIKRRDIPADQMRALDDMKDITGTSILSASATGQPAFESGVLGQGLLTYSLLSAIKNKDGLRQNTYLDVDSWFKSATNSVKNMAKGIGERQDPQYVKAPTFDVGMVDREIINGIKLGLNKKILGRAIVYSGDPLVMADTLELSDALNRELDNLSVLSRSGFSYIENSRSQQTYLIRGEYHMEGNQWVANLRLVKNGTSPKEIKVMADQTGILVKKIAEAVAAILNKDTL